MLPCPNSCCELSTCFRLAQNSHWPTWAFIPHHTRKLEHRQGSSGQTRCTTFSQRSVCSLGADGASTGGPGHTGPGRVLSSQPPCLLSPQSFPALPPSSLWCALPASWFHDHPGVCSGSGCTPEDHAGPGHRERKRDGPGRLCPDHHRVNPMEVGVGLIHPTPPPNPTPDDSVLVWPCTQPCS